MWNTGFVVADRVLPDVPIRQWVLSTPFELRLLLAANAGAFSALTRIFAEEVLALQRRRARRFGMAGAEGGLLVFQHRFGGSLNLNTHLHAVAVDGVFTRPSVPAASRAEFHRLPAPERADLQGVVFRAYRRFVAWLRRRGLLRLPGDADLESSAPSAIQACLRGSLGVGNLLTLPDSAKDPVSAVDDARRFALTRSPCAAEFGGFGVHAGVTVREGDAAARARLVRYCARAPLSLDRLSITDDGMVVYRIRRPWRKQQTCRVMTPLDFLGRLCALIPPPRHPLLRFYGAFAPHFTWRALCVPEARPAESSPDCAAANQSDVGPAPVGPPEPRSTQASPAAATTVEPLITAGSGIEKSRIGEALTSRNPWRIDWRTLLKRTYDFDVLHCECGGTLKAVALVTEREAARELLERLGLPSRPPPLARARSPDEAA